MVRRAKSIILCFAGALLISVLCACGSMQKTVVSIEPLPSASPAPRETSGSDAGLSGDWYGWWRIYDAGGEFSSMHGYWWDCCAVIKAGKNGTSGIVIWDEDSTKEKYLAKAELKINDGVPCFSSGSFMDSRLGAEAWDVRLSTDRSGQLLTIKGKADKGGTGYFSYEICLRPWGSIWQTDEDKLPYYYSEWYLPLIKNGSPMPDKIG